MEVLIISFKTQSEDILYLTWNVKSMSSYQHNGDIRFPWTIYKYNFPFNDGENYIVIAHILWL